ncbi:MAG: LysR family transcriptional regulator [Oleiphilaceae bacterium]|nr:LysR family transcriptional regulator [Oleiphilaceae bacterium]
MPLSVQQLANRLTFRQLQVFLGVYQLKSYSKAGDLLGLTQPAISSQIKHLETALGIPVFEYVGRKLYCTAAGEKLAQSTHIIFNELRSLQNDLAALRGQVAGDLNLVAVNTAQYVVPYLLKAFHQQHPDINVQMRVVNRSEALRRLNDNQDHLVIMGIVPTEKPLTSLPFLDNEFLPVVPGNHPLLQSDSPGMRDFINSGLLVREPGSGSRLAFDLYCQQNRLTYQPKMELGSNDALKHAVLAGLGVAVLPKLSILPELRLGLLKVLPIAGFQLKRSWCVVHQKSKHPTPAMRAFLDFVQANLNTLATQFQSLEQ